MAPWLSDPGLDGLSNLRFSLNIGKQLSTLSFFQESLHMALAPPCSEAPLLSGRHFSGSVMASLPASPVDALDPFPQSSALPLVNGGNEDYRTLTWGRALL